MFKPTTLKEARDEQDKINLFTLQLRTKRIVKTLFKFKVYKVSISTSDNTSYIYDGKVWFRNLSFGPDFYSLARTVYKNPGVFILDLEEELPNYDIPLFIEEKTA